MKLNIVYKNEMKLMARSRRLLASVVIFNAFLSVVLLICLQTIRNECISSGTAPYSSMLLLNMGLLSVTAVLLALFMTPGASASVAGERERQTLDILLSTRLTSVQIVAGKILSSATGAILLLVSGLPVITVTLMYGGLGLGQIYLAVLYLGFFIFLAAGAGVMCSCLFRTVTAATVAAYGLLLFFTGGTGLLVLLASLAFNTEGGGGLFALSWLLNPAVTFAGVVCRQVGDSLFDEALELMGVSGGMIPYWLPVSLILQLCLLALMFAVSVRRIGSR